MAIQDRLLVLCDGADPAAITAYGDADANIKYIGGVVAATYTGVYSTFPDGSAGPLFPQDKPMFLNLFNSGSNASIGGANRYIFQLVGDGSSSGARASGDQVLCHAEFLGTDMTKGWSASIPIAFTPIFGAFLKVAMGSHAASANEAARIDAWLGVDPVSWTTYTEGNN